jgi:NAD(P)-dependent dehydrogenase (short-subunit alcohol dehydrogenase family)
MTDSELSERTCVVTGAGSMVGRAIAATLASAGATVYDADPSDAAEVESLARDLLAHEGGIDFLVHGAGTASPQDADVRAACLLAEALVPGLSQNRGQVVVVSSMGALTASAARTALSNSLRRAVHPHGVPVVNVYAPARLQQPEDVASLVLGALAPL